MQLTNQEIARVFAMYWGQEILMYEGDNDRYPINRHNIDCKHLYLNLTPLSKISDEDAVDVAKFTYTDKELLELIQIGNDYVNYNLCGGSLSSYSSQRLKKFSCVEDIQIFQYLISKGYAVPLFFSPNHPANGKTAIELNIAKEK